jgi:PST family polysaccharide transporter
MRVSQQINNVPLGSNVATIKQLTQDDIFDANHFSNDLANKSVRGAISTMSAQGVQFILQFTGTIILARLLTPADYGLIGMVLVVVNFAAMFKDAGLSMATVQKDTITREQISTLFWINVLISMGLGLCVLVGSPVVSWFYDKPELTAVTATLSFSFIISGLSIQHEALLRRHMRFDSLAIVQIASQTLTLIVTIISALNGLRYWALILGALTTALSTVILTFYFCPWIPGRMRKSTGVRDMLKFGSHLTGFNFINYFSRNADFILIGRFISPEALGLYSKAYQLFMMPISQIRGPITNVAMPVLSTLQDQPHKYLRYYQTIIDIIATLSVPLTIYCVLEADFIINLLLGPQWIGAVTVFRILAIAGLIQPIAGTRGLVMLSYGHSERYFKWGIINAIFCVSSFIIGIPWGIEGVATAYAIVNFAILIPSLFYCFDKTPVSVALFLKRFIPPLIFGTFAGFAVIVSKLVLTDNTIMAHGICLAIFVLIYSALSMSRSSIRETVAIISKHKY